MKFIYKISYIIFLIYCYKYKNKIYEINGRRINLIKNNTIDLNYIKSLKKLVFTTLFGNYDNIQSIKQENGYDYFMFTDKKIENKTTNWIILNVEKNLNFSNKREAIKRQRFYKAHPHLFFKNYDLSIYIDATFKIKGNLDDFLLRIFTPNFSIYILEHPFITTINNEFKAVLHFKKETLDVINPIKERYKKEKFPDVNGHAETCLIVRIHNELNCINFMENWFYQIKHYSHRDQLSFNYILWKNRNKNVKYIPKEYIKDYFNQSLFHLKNVEFKNL